MEGHVYKGKDKDKIQEFTDQVKGKLYTPTAKELKKNLSFLNTRVRFYTRKTDELSTKRKEYLENLRGKMSLQATPMAAPFVQARPLEVPEPRLEEFLGPVVEENEKEEMNVSNEMAEEANENLPELRAQLEQLELGEEVNDESKNAPVVPVVNVKGGDCDVYYDPCTGQRLEPNSLEALERRVKELKQKTVDHPEIKQFPPEIRSRLDLLLTLLNDSKPPSADFFQYTINGQLYEAMWDIVFSLNLLDEFPNKPNFFMINKKAEALRGTDDAYVKNPLEYLKSRNVNEGASGASDITFCYKEEKEKEILDECSKPILTTGTGVVKTQYFFCSSKFYKKDASKSAESFDIQKIYTAVKSLHQDFDVRIILLVKDKDAVDTKLKNARNKYISEEASKVYGEKQLFAALLKLYVLAKQKIQGVITEESLRSILGISEKGKPILSPRLHQHIAILKMKYAIENFKRRGGNNKFLVGILPRGGKTYIAGGIVSTLQPKRVVVLLGAKSETINQFTDDLFSYYQDFADYQVVDVVKGGRDTPIDPSKKYIFVMSVELYKTESSTRRILQELKGGAHRADLFICDEAHLKQTTGTAIKEMEAGTAPAKSGEELDSEENGLLKELDESLMKDVPVVYMTGTYIKPLKVFQIPEDNVVVWEYEDIQHGKTIADSDEYFRVNFPDIYEEALAKCFAFGDTYESIQSMYKRFPNLYLLSTQFTDDAKGAFLEQKSKVGEKVGFPTITHLFQVKKDFNPAATEPTLWYTGFTNPGGMFRLLNYLSPKPAQSEEGGEISSVMERIDRISQRIGDRLSFFTKDFVVHSQLWFLPSMTGHPLIKRMSALAGVIFRNKWYSKNFNILAVSSSIDWSGIPGSKDKRVKVGDGKFIWACPNSSETLKACVLREEARARKKGKGLIILAQNMLHLGISLTCVDIVVLLDAGEKVDERIQKMYRALTESTNKKGGYIVDMNYFRTVTAIMNYEIQRTKTRQKKEVYADQGLAQAFNSVIETYSIDDDLPIYSVKEEGGGSRISSETLPELQRMLQTAPKGRTNGMTISEVGKALNTNIENVLKGEYNEKGLDHILGELADDEEKMRVLREGGDGVEMAEEMKEEGEDYEDGPNRPPAPKLFSDEVAANPVEKRKAFMDIFKTTLKLGIFGTSYKSIPDLIEGLRSDPELQEVVFDTLVKRGAIQEGADPAFVNRLIQAELGKLVTEEKASSYSGMKEAFNSRDTQSQKYQEVLTYIVEHLTPKDKERHKFGEVFTPLTLVDEMLSKLPEEVWSKKEFKWLDPANGIGNFPIKAFLGQSEGPHTYPGLNEGLKKAIPDDEERCKHIIENMLYMVDINGKNNLIARRLFEKLCPGAKANIEQIDKKNGFLADKPLLFNGKEVKEFDVIMGNPPFNRGGINRPDTRKNKKVPAYEGEKKEKRETLWNRFVVKSFALLKERGFINFIHPIGWFHPGDYDDVRDILLKQQLHTVKIYHKTQAKKEFGGKGEISVAYYLLEKKEVTDPTVIQGMSGKTESIKLSTKSILLLNNSSIINKIISKSLFWKLNKNFKHVSNECKPGTYKQIKGIYDTGNIEFVKVEKKHVDQDIPKLVVSGATYPRIYYDKDGEYGLIGSGVNYWIGDKKSLDNIEKFMKTKLSAFLTKELRFRQGFVEFKYFPDITQMEIDTITDKSLAEFFGLTKEEQGIVNTTEFPVREYKFKEVTCNQGKPVESVKGGGSLYKKTYKVRKTGE